MHVLFQIRPRLIIISFLVDKSRYLGISFNEAHRPQSTNSFRGEVFSLLSVFSVRHDFRIWVSSVTQIMCLPSPTNKRRLASFEKWPRVGFLAVYSSAPIMVAVCFSLLTHTWLIWKWDSLMNMSPRANREGWREVAFPLPLFLVTTNVS